MRVFAEQVKTGRFRRPQIKVLALRRPYSDGPGFTTSDFNAVALPGEDHIVSERIDLAVRAF
jgi:hypothetical protein